MEIKAENNKSAVAPAVMVAAALTVLFHGISIFLPESRLWGFNHLLFVSTPYMIVSALGAIIALLLVVPAFSVSLNNRLSRIAEPLFTSTQYRRWLLFSLAAIPAFWFLRMPTNLLGDGYTVINNIADDVPVVFKWSEIGAVGIIHFVAGLLPVEGLRRGEYAFAIVSVLSGSATLFFFFGLARQAADSLSGRIFIFSLLIFSGWMLLFFGYAENYPVLWPFMTGYLYFGLRYIQNRTSLLWPSLFLLIALIVHLQSLFFLISYPLLLISRGKGRRFYRRHARSIGLAVIVISLTGVALFVYKYLTALEFKIHFLPPFFGRPATPGYAVFSPAHLLDILNQLSLLIPVWPVLLTWTLFSKRDKVDDPTGRFLAAFSIGGAIFLLILDPRIGMGRDWDLFALTGLGPLLYLSRLCLRSKPDSKVSLSGIAVLSLVLVFPCFATNLSYQPSIEYMKSLLRLDMAKSKPGIVMLRDYYRDIDRDQTADSLNKEIAKNFPLVHLADYINRLSTSGQITKAMHLADSVYRADPYSAETVNIMGITHYHAGDYQKAIDYYSQSARLKPYDPRVRLNLATNYKKLGRMTEAFDYLREAQKLNPDMPEVNEHLSTVFFNQRQFDSANHYARKLVRTKPDYPGAYFALGMAAMGLRDAETARKSFNRFLYLSPEDPKAEMARKMLEKLDSLEVTKNQIDMR